MLCQGERAILETTFRYPGQFMFHAHQSEFAELGWMGLFEAVVSAAMGIGKQDVRHASGSLALLPLVLLAALLGWIVQVAARPRRCARACRRSRCWRFQRVDALGRTRSCSRCSTTVPTR